MIPWTRSQGGRRRGPGLFPKSCFRSTLDLGGEPAFQGEGSGEKLRDLAAQRGVNRHINNEASGNALSNDVIDGEMMYQEKT